MNNNFALVDENNEVIRFTDASTSGAVKVTKPIMKQSIMFDVDSSLLETEYTSKISAPIYSPKNIKPHILQLCENSKSKNITKRINESNLPTEEKEFLIHASNRLNVFNYEAIADYYSHSNIEMQNFMEELALVIIDFDKAIELGFVQLSEDIREQYLEYYDGAK